MDFLDLRPKLHILNSETLAPYCGSERTRILLELGSIDAVRSDAICPDCRVVLGCATP